MPAYPYNDLRRDLQKGKFPPAVYLHGPAEILKDELIQQIVEGALDPGARELNYEQRTIAELDPESLHTLVETLPMFGGRRVVVLRGIEGLKKKPRLREVLLAALARSNDDTVLVLIETAPADEDRKSKPDADLVAATRAVAVEGLDPEHTVRWVQHRAQAAGVRFAEGAAEHLAEATGYDLGALKAEIDKLSALPNTDPITIEQVGELVGIRHGETASDWRIAVLEGESARALKLLGPVLLQSGNSGVKLVSMLGTSLVALWLARSRFDQGDKGGRLVSA
ncbi:MAG TPA: DNA polymerase III subunit delta, partial [Gemmatimonadales bacterium]|nr:DNA polymerase III subunit delta [Gemmatimonadales bacterium]